MKWNTVIIYVLSIVGVFAFVACDSDDDDDTDTAGKNGADTSGSADDDKVTGLGEPCMDESTECDGFEANYCLAAPDEMGECTITDCQTEPDDCPVGWKCCDLVFPDPPNMCMRENEFNETAGVCVE